MTQAGDIIAVSGHRLGEAEQTAEVLEVLGDAGHEHYRVRWDDGHESVLYPGSDAHVRGPAREDRKEKNR
jgi:hypothetical protein